VVHSVGQLKAPFDAELFCEISGHAFNDDPLLAAAKTRN
jgi:hypothetical protein